jgi:hypothetical protein
MNQITRREFAALVAAGTVAGHAARPLAFGQAGSGQVTAADIIERIRKNIGVDWRAETVDTIKAGDASTRVTGVVTTSLASLTVLQQAVKAGANFVITFEPTFYSRGDAPTPPAGRGAGPGGRGAAGAPPAPPPPPRPPDPVFTAKNDFIARNNLVVFRLSDHWRLRTPDPLASGFASALGWTSHQSASDPRRFDVPAITLEALTASLKKALQSRGGIRVIGDRQTRVQRVALLPGNTPIQASLAALPNVDVIIAGEVREWESVEYVRDVVFSGQRKGMILVGRVVSGEPGMAVCANWLRTFVTEVPVRHIAAGDPYWRPA